MPGNIPSLYTAAIELFIKHGCIQCAKQTCMDLTQLTTPGNIMSAQHAVTSELVTNHKIKLSNSTCTYVIKSLKKHGARTQCFQSYKAKQNEHLYCLMP